MSDQRTPFGRRPMRSTFLAVLGLALVAALAAGCSLFGQHDSFGNVQVTNSTDVPIDVVFIPDDGSPERVLRHIDAHKSDTFDAFGEGCSAKGAMVARGPDGGEVARLAGPICQQTTWTVAPSQAP